MRNLTEAEIKKLKKEGKVTVCPPRKAKGSASPFRFHKRAWRKN